MKGKIIAVDHEKGEATAQFENERITFSYDGEPLEVGQECEIEDFDEQCPTCGHWSQMKDESKDLN